MPTDSEYRDRIRLLSQSELLVLWRQILSGRTPGWGSGKAFEYVILRAFELEGARVVWPFGISLAGDRLEQIDGVVYCDGLAALFECKDYSKPVNFEPIAKLRQQLARRPPSVIGCCFAKRGFTEEAKLLAERSSPQNVLFWQGGEIEFALKNGKMREGLLAKFQHMVEYAIPDFTFVAP